MVQWHGTCLEIRRSQVQFLSSPGKTGKTFNLKTVIAGNTGLNGLIIGFCICWLPVLVRLIIWLEGKVETRIGTY